jgi:hypothetical protein
MVTSWPGNTLAYYPGDDVVDYVGLTVLGMPDGTPSSATSNAGPWLILTAVLPSRRRTSRPHH